MTHTVRALDPDAFRAANDLFVASLHRPPRTDGQWTHVQKSYLQGRVFGVHAGDALVGTSMSFPSRVAVPGGAALPMAAITRVGVRPDHTRRGILTALMRAEFDAAAERGEPVVSLRASEAVIYGRFGYGVATRGRHVRLPAGPRSALRPSAPRGGAVRLLDRADIVAHLQKLHDRLALRAPGGITRSPGWWASGIINRIIIEPQPVIAAVHTGPGGDDGYALAVATDLDSDTDRTLDVLDLHATDTPATAALWRFLLNVDLISWVAASLRPLDEPLEALLADPRACRVTGNEDETWLRIIDVPAAMAARTYQPADPVLLAVHDPIRPSNTGLYRIADGAAEHLGPLDGRHPAQLECDVAGLATAYLGDRSPSALVATGWWQAPDPAAAPAADAAFATPTVPWCGTYF